MARHLSPRPSALPVTLLGEWVKGVLVQPPAFTIRTINGLVKVVLWCIMYYDVEWCWHIMILWLLFSVIMLCSNHQLSSSTIIYYHYYHVFMFFYCYYLLFYVRSLLVPLLPCNYYNIHYCSIFITTTSINHYLSIIIMSIIILVCAYHHIYIYIWVADKISYYPQWTWPKWVVPYRLWRFVLPCYVQK